MTTTKYQYKENCRYKKYAITGLPHTTGLPVNLDIGTTSPINRAIFPLLNKAQPGENANGLGQKPGKDVL